MPITILSTPKKQKSKIELYVRNHLSKNLIQASPPKLCTEERKSLKTKPQVSRTKTNLEELSFVMNRRLPPDRQRKLQRQTKSRQSLWGMQHVSLPSAISMMLIWLSEGNRIFGAWSVTGAVKRQAEWSTH